MVMNLYFKFRLNKQLRESKNCLTAKNLNKKEVIPLRELKASRLMFAEEVAMVTPM